MSTQHEAAPRRSRPSPAPPPSRAPLAVAFLIALGALAGTGYIVTRIARQRDDASAAHAAARARAARTEARARDAEAELGRERDRARALEATAAEERERARARETALTQARSAFATERGQLTAQLEETRRRAQEVESIAARMRALVPGSNGEARADGDRVSLQLVDRVLFRAGEAELTPEGTAVLAQVADVLRSFPDKQVWVHGHTDVAAVPDPARFPTNWELSTARALAVVHFLQDQAHIEPRRLAAVGFAQYRPLSRRASAQNRRIEIVLFPEDVRVSRADARASARPAAPSR